MRSVNNGPTLIFVITFLCGCSLTSERSYQEIMQEDSVVYSPGRDFILTLGDTGRNFETPLEVEARTPASSHVPSELRQQISLKREVEQLEQIQPQVLTEQYDRYKEYFSTESEKIYFLRLSSLEDRERFLVDKGIKRSMSPQIINKENAAQYSWKYKSKSSIWNQYGAPESVESAQEDEERWNYRIPSSNGTRTFYFTGDKVEGHAHDRKSP